MPVMRIRFICSRVQAGSCGVGDYTRRLAAAVVRRGISVEIVATHDREINTSKEELLQEEEVKIPCLRIAVGDSTARREALKDPVSQEDEIWSFQFSGFQAYHPQGWPYAFREQIGQYLEERERLHIMCHELSFDPKVESWKKKFLGLLQQRELRRFFRRASPFLLHTHTPYYRFRLRNFGAEASLLQLFGNIPHFSAGGEPFQQLEEAKEKRNAWIAGVFGTVHPNWDPMPFLNSILPVLESQGIHLVLSFIGRNGPHLSPCMKRLKNTYGDRCSMLVLGEQPPEKIAEFFHTLQFGISTNGWGLNAKSGTVAALLDFGVPVVVVQDTSYAHHGEVRMGLVRHRGEKTFFQDIEDARASFSQQQVSCLEVVAHQFLEEVGRVLQITKKK